MKHIEQITKHYKIIQELDKTIVQLDKFANQIINSESIIKFNFSVEDLNANIRGVTTEAMEDNFSFGHAAIMFSFGRPPQQKETNISKQTFKIDTKTTLIVVGLMVKSFTEKRDAIIEKINELMQTPQEK